MAEIQFIVTRGYGNGFFAASIQEIVARGYHPAVSSAVVGASMKSKRIKLGLGINSIIKT